MPVISAMSFKGLSWNSKASLVVSMLLASARCPLAGHTCWKQLLRMMGRLKMQGSERVRGASVHVSKQYLAINVDLLS